MVTFEVGRDSSEYPVLSTLAIQGEGTSVTLLAPTIAKRHTPTYVHHVPLVVVLDALWSSIDDLSVSKLLQRTADAVRKTEAGRV